MLQQFGRVFILALCSSMLFAHEFNPAHLVVSEVEDSIYEVNWMYPSKNIGSRAEVLFPISCEREGQSPIQQGKYLVETLLLTCDQSLKGQVIEVVNLSVLTDALVTIKHLDGEVFEGLINLKRSSLTVPLKEQVYPLGYFNLGVEWRNIIFHP